MLHIGHDNHHMVFFPEAVRHPHHILSASAKWREENKREPWDTRENKKNESLTAQHTITLYLFFTGKQHKHEAM